MTCGAIMTENPLATREDETVGEAAARLIQHRYINLPVVNPEGRFLGMFGIYDLFSLIIPKVALAGGLLFSGAASAGTWPPRAAPEVARPIVPTAPPS